LDDKRFALDHFQTKLLRIPDDMKTGAGRAMANDRSQVLRMFLEALAREFPAGCLKTL
jgi:uncharacterized protein